METHLAERRREVQKAHLTLGRPGFDGNLPRVLRAEKQQTIPGLLENRAVAGRAEVSTAQLAQSRPVQPCC
jgi:hypothetical protein